MFSILVHHPDDPAQCEIMVSSRDVEVINEAGQPD
jgi:hypothetical protein